jgi:hypothetical protein
MITSFEEAQLLYSMCEAERCKRELALQDAQAGLQQAQQRFKCARKRLTKAEFRLGKTRYIVKKSGFSDVLQKKICSVRPRPTIVKSLRTYVPFYYFESSSQSMPLRKSFNRNTWRSLHC